MATAAVCELVGALHDVAFHRCALLLQELSVLHPGILPKLTALTETDYFGFLDGHVHAIPRSAISHLQRDASPFVLVNETRGFLDGEAALLEFAGAKTGLSAPQMLAAAVFGAAGSSTSELSEEQLATAEAKLDERADAAVREALFRYRHKSGRPFAFLVFTIDGVALPRVEIELYHDICPRTCDNFLAFCQSRIPVDDGEAGEAVIGYVGVPVHRVVKGGWIQSGDVAGSGSGDGPSLSLYGGEFSDESFAVSHNASGIVSMASDRPHANGSQFFITLTPQPWLDRRKVAFGRVVCGLRAILAIGNIETQGERPCVPCVIANCGVIE